MEIAYKAREDVRPSVEPALMAAWLARQLAWQPPRIDRAGDGSWTIIAAADGREVTIRLRPAAGARLPIDEVLIESGLDGRRGTFRAALRPAVR